MDTSSGQSMQVNSCITSVHIYASTHAHTSAHSSAHSSARTSKHTHAYIIMHTCTTCYILSNRLSSASAFITDNIESNVGSGMFIAGSTQYVTITNSLLAQDDIQVTFCCNGQPRRVVSTLICGKFRFHVCLFVYEYYLLLYTSLDKRHFARDGELLLSS